MSGKLLKTNLGKWGRNTQTFHEHGYATLTFRRVLNFPSYLLVAEMSRRCGNGQYLVERYDELVHLETVYHDYDKLFMREDLVSDLGAMRSFREHADVESPRNSEALNLTLEEMWEDPFLPDKVRDLIGTLDDELLAKVLRAANASHEGERTPEKVNMVADALSDFFDALGCPLKDPVRLARPHLLSLRAADSIASAWEGRPSFKSDVTEVVESIRSTRLFEEPVIHVTSISLNPAFLEARSTSTVVSFLEFYNWLRSLVEERLVNFRLGDVLVPRGSVIEDNSNVIVSIWLGRPGFTGLEELSSIPERVLEDLISIEDRAVAISRSKADFDLRLREALMDSLVPSFNPAPREGITCFSCGRPGARLMKGEELQEMGVRVSEFMRVNKQDLMTLERGMRLGYMRATFKMYGLRRRPEHNDKPLCETCAWLLSRTKPVSGILVTFVMYGVERDFIVRSEPCSDATDPLVERIFSYHLRDVKLRRLLSHTSTRVRRYGLSVLVLEFIRRKDALLPTLVDLLNELMSEFAELKVKLPCGEVRYGLRWALRVGKGMIVTGKVSDYSLLKGLWEPEEYLTHLSKVQEVVSGLRSLGLKPNEVVNKLEGGRGRVAAALLKEIEARPKASLREFISLVEEISSWPHRVRLIDAVREVV